MQFLRGQFDVDDLERVARGAGVLFRFEDGLLVIACVACSKSSLGSWCARVEVPLDELATAIEMTAREACLMARERGCQHWNEFVRLLDESGGVSGFDQWVE